MNKLMQASFPLTPKESLWEKQFIQMKINNTTDCGRPGRIYEQLALKNEIFKQAEQLSGLGSWTWNLSTEDIFYSDNFYSIYGLEPQSVTPNWAAFSKYTHPEDCTKVDKAIQKMFHKHQEFDLEYRIHRPDGKLRHLKIKNQLISTPLDEKVFIGSIQDITQQKLTEEKLQIEYQKLSEAQQMAHIGSWEYDIAKNKVVWSDELYRIHGLEPQECEITYEKATSFFKQEDKKLLNNLVRKALKTGESYEKTSLITSANGEKKWVKALAEVIKDDNGKPLFIRGTTQDITKQELAKEVLLKSEALFKQAEAIAHVGSWEHQLYTGKISWSDELYRIYGLEPQCSAPTFETLYSLIHPEDLSLVKKINEQVLINHKFEPYSMRIVRKNGDIRYVNCHGTVVVDKKNDILTIVGTAQDVTEQKLAEQQLIASEERFRLLINALPQMAWTSLPNGDADYFNDRTYKYTGLSPDEMKGFGWGETIHPDFQAEADRLWLQAVTNNEPYELEFKAKRYDNEYRWHLARAVPIMEAESDKIIAWVGTSTDIHDGKLIEERLKENQRFIQHITDTTPDVIDVFDILDRKTHFLNRDPYRVLGYSTQTVAGFGRDVVKILMHPDDLSASLKYKSNLSALKDNEISQIEIRIKDSAGEWQWFRRRDTIFKKKEDGTVWQVIGINQLITEQKKAEEQLRESQHFIERITDSTPDILYVIDLRELRIIYINRAVSEILYYSVEEILNMREQFMELLIHPDDQERVYQSLEFFMEVKGNELKELEYRLKDSYGNWHWIKCRKTVFKRDEKGIPIQLIGLSHDITESKKLEEESINFKLMQQKEISNAILQTQEEERKRIAEALHNGLGQVLYGAKLSLNILDPDKNDLKKDNIEIKTTINALLDDAIEATRTISFELMPTVLQDFGLDTVLKDLLRKTLPKASIKYNLSLSGLKARMEADVEVAIFRIMQELINNVLKHAHATAANIIVNKSSDYISILFADNGAGFNAALTAKIKGFGLRSISNRVKLLNGQLNIESAKGKGTSVSIDIPYNYN